CEVREGESLPILHSQEMVEALDTFRQTNHVTSVFIGIICDQSMLTSAGENGDPIEFDNFIFPPATPCSDKSAFVQSNFRALWLGKVAGMEISSYVCARRYRYLSSPSLLWPSSPSCLFGMFLLDDWCYTFDELPIGECDYEASH
ncbi:hypothetical protein PENTCL1PPCAC_10284, partial [Pristionchus entomophagus]